jgi:hypothetical protein
LITKVKPQITEKEVENQILEWLGLKGIFAWKNQSIGVFDPRRNVFRKPKSKHQINGVSDILGILPDGRFLAIEVKRPLKKARTDEALMVIASDDQQAFILKIRESGGLAFVADRIGVVIEKLDMPPRY